jgi:hypothetical protein
MSFSRRVLHMDPCPWPALMRIADATGYPLTHPHVLRQDATPVRPVILVRAPRVPVPSGTHGEPRTTTVRNSLIVHEKASLLTVGYGPDLCKAVLQPDGLNTDNRSRLVNRLYPQAVHTVCMRSPPNPPYHLTPNELLNETLLAYRPRNASTPGQHHRVDSYQDACALVGSLTRMSETL